MTISSSFFFASANYTPLAAYFGIAIPLQESRIRREQRARAASIGERVQWVTDFDGVERMAFMRKFSGMLIIFDVDL